MSKTKDPTTTEALRAYESMTPEEQLRRYRGLLKSHRQLEARVREDDRATQWWKGRTEVLDTRARELGAKLGAALNENRALMKTVGLLEAEVVTKRMAIPEAGSVLKSKRERINYKENDGRSKGVNTGTQTDLQEENQKDIAVREMIQTLWNAQPGAGAISETCGCESARALRATFLRGNNLGRVTEKGGNPLGVMLVRQKSRKGGGSRSETLEERGASITTDRISLASNTKTISNTKAAPTSRTTSATKTALGMDSAAAKPRSTYQASGALTNTALAIEAPPNSYSETFSTARKERKQALKMKLRATREMVDGLRKENGVLEGLLGEGGGGEVNRVEWTG